MNTFFSTIPNEPRFQLLSLSHIVPLVILAILLVVMTKYRTQIKQFRYEKYIRYFLVLTLLISDLSIYVWRFSTGTLLIQSHLPFHLCTITTYILTYVLITKNQKVFNYIFYAGLAGAIMALAYPTYGNFNYTQYRYYEYFIIHIALVSGLMYMVLVHHFIPRLSALIKSTIAVQIYAIFFIIPFNLLFDGTYMMLVNPRESVVNLVGPWPQNIIILELLLFILLGLSYLITYITVLRKE